MPYPKYFFLLVSGIIAVAAVLPERTFSAPAHPQLGMPFSDEKIIGLVGAWGVLPTQDHSQPEIPQGVRTILDRYDSLYIGANDKKTVYLTFDEGYEKGYTPHILDVLKKQSVKAAFFVTGHYINKHPDLVKRMVAEGHTVGNHTMHHPSMRGLGTTEIESELNGVNDAFYRLTGQKMTYLRPPRGEYDENALAVSKKMGYRMVFWSLAMADWLPLNGGPQESHNTVMDRLHSGALILLHAVSPDNDAALDQILSDIKAQGYTFGTLDQLTREKDKSGKVAPSSKI